MMQPNARSPVVVERGSVALGRRLAMTCVGQKGWMAVVWAATSPESGLFDPVARRSEVKDLSGRFHDLRSVARGTSRFGRRTVPGAGPDLPR
jgi:hypothetical protein